MIRDDPKPTNSLKPENEDSMKKFVTALCLIGATAALSACAAKGKNVHNEEASAPYATERTVGSKKVNAEPLFKKSISK